MRASLQVFLAVIIVVTLSFVGFVLYTKHGGYDRFPEMKLTSDKATYQLGDKIELNIHFNYRGGHQMRLFKDLSRSAQMRIVGAYNEDRVEHLKSAPNDYSKPYTSNDIDEIYSKLPIKVERKIRGKFYKEGNRNIVTFENFGSFEVKEPISVAVHLHFYPVKPDPSAKLEDFVAPVEIQFELPVKAQVVEDDVEETDPLAPTGNFAPGWLESRKAIPVAEDPEEKKEMTPEEIKKKETAIAISAQPPLPPPAGRLPASAVPEEVKAAEPVLDEPTEE